MADTCDSTLKIIKGINWGMSGPSPGRVWGMSGACLGNHQEHVRLPKALRACEWFERRTRFECSYLTRGDNGTPLYVR